jgi:sortase A
MTAVETASSTEPAESYTPSEAAPAPDGPAPADRRSSTAIEYVAAALGLLVVLVLGFGAYLYGLSSISEARVQNTLYRTFAGELGQAVAPVGPTTEGAPVAILNIPEIGVKNTVVVEGTTSRDLTEGPGHLPSTVLPGQQGISAVYGKRTTFGAPFAHLMRLNRGDRFTVTTGQGLATYVVESFGTEASPPPDPAANRMLLITADSSYAPGSAVMVSADLASSAQPSPGGLPSASAEEHTMASDFNSLIPLVLWSQALLIASVLGALAAHRWSRWPAYLVTAPVVLALAWCVYENVAGLLPNLY